MQWQPAGHRWSPGPQFSGSVVSRSVVSQFSSSVEQALAKLESDLEMYLPQQVYGRALKISTRFGRFTTAILSDVALGAVERNARVRATELRDLLSGLG